MGPAKLQRQMSSWVALFAHGRNTIQYLRATGAAQLYAGAMSPPAAEQVIAALQLIGNADGSGRGPAKLTQLRENSNYFRAKLQEIGLNVLGDADSPVMVRGSDELRERHVTHAVCHVPNL